MKKIICFILTITVILSFSAGAFAKGNQVISNINEVWDFCDDSEPSIYTATLTVDGQPKNVYCVACDGMDFYSFDPNNPRSVTNGIKLVLSCENNKYLKTVCNAILNTVPKGETLVFVGRSLGGIVLQQVSAQASIKESYEILTTLAVGSPYIFTKSSKEGTLRRCVDIADPVPFLSLAGLTNPLIGNVSFAASGILFNTHMRAYSEGRCWRQYDFLGVKNGGATLTVIEKLL